MVHGSLGLLGWCLSQGFTLLSHFSQLSLSQIGLLASVNVNQHYSRKGFPPPPNPPEKAFQTAKKLTLLMVLEHSCLISLGRGVKGEGTQLTMSPCCLITMLLVLSNIVSHHPCHVTRCLPPHPNTKLLLLVTKCLVLKLLVNVGYQMLGSQVVSYCWLSNAWFFSM